ncbi:MAG: hypothetical protein JNJ58_10925 [Chitinophagaceae bacterium]|nr:hypothetical protein [Chitinophagaceae bacterium]
MDIVPQALTSVGQAFNISTQVLTSVGQVLNISHEVLTAVGQVFNISTQVLTAVGQVFNISTQVLTSVSQTLNISTQALTSVGQVFDISTQVLTAVSQTLNISHEAMSGVGQVLNIVPEAMTGVGAPCIDWLCNRCKGFSGPRNEFWADRMHTRGQKNVSQPADSILKNRAKYSQFQESFVTWPLPVSLKEINKIHPTKFDSINIIRKFIGQTLSLRSCVLFTNPTL